MKLRSSLYIFWLMAGLQLQAQAPQELDIERQNRGEVVKPIPVSMSGFTGEVDSVIRFDLYVAGFEFVTDKPQYTIVGKNNGTVEGRVNDAVSQAQIMVKAYNGANQRALAHTLANDIIFAITGKKGICLSKIAFKIDRGGSSEIYVSDYDGHGAAQVTTDKNQVAMPAWVPGQRKLLYCTWKHGPTQIYIQDLNQGVRKGLAQYPGSNFSPAVSPDGRRVAMILSKTANLELFVCNIDGSNLKQLTKTKEDESSPCWAPDSSTICYVGRSGLGERAGLYKISASGGEPRRVRVGNVVNLTEPDWSPDGKSIVFTAQMGSFSVCTVPAEGGEAKILTEGEDPCWAANSRTVIFTRRHKNKRVLSLLDVPTKRVKDAAQISGSCSQASWSR